MRVKLLVALLIISTSSNAVEMIPADDRVKAGEERVRYTSNLASPKFQDEASPVAAGQATPAPKKDTAKVEDKTKGVNIFVSQSLAKIMPSGWLVKLPVKERIQRVTWGARKGEAWTDTLSFIGKQAGIDFIVDAERRIVTSKNFVPSSSEPAKASLYGNSRTWTISAGDEISSTIKKWGKQDGWQTSWDVGEHFVVATDASFKGSLKEALNAVLKSIAHSNDLSLMADFYESNKVLRVYKEVK
ncbi:MAG: toxin co-regulated pilus biosynthesis Q family protein [Gammaproteobacteria bacterium]|nr:toxin co-regulated pilus biosynthesis Q family protein [Gammaproteobacteria bacterium]